jgi:hypothetical protein
VWSDRLNLFLRLLQTYLTRHAPRRWAPFAASRTHPALQPSETIAGNVIQASLANFLAFKPRLVPAPRTHLGGHRASPSTPQDKASARLPRGEGSGSGSSSLGRHRILSPFERNTQWHHAQERHELVQESVNAKTKR